MSTILAWRVIVATFPVSKSKEEMSVIEKQVSDNLKAGFVFDGDMQVSACTNDQGQIHTTILQRMVKYKEEVSSITQTEEGVKINYKSKFSDEKYAYSKQAVEDMYIELIGMADLSQGKGLSAKQVKEAMYRNLGKSE